MSDRRTHRVASLIRAELSRLFIEEIADPRVKEVTVTQVEVSGDLKNARVYFDAPFLNELKRLSEVQRGLDRVKPFIRKRMAENVGLRYVPDFKFEYDTQSQELTKLYQAFDEIRKES